MLVVDAARVVAPVVALVGADAQAGDDLLRVRVRARVRVRVGVRVWAESRVRVRVRVRARVSLPSTIRVSLGPCTCPLSTPWPLGRGGIQGPWVSLPSTTPYLPSSNGRTS